MSLTTITAPPVIPTTEGPVIGEPRPDGSIAFRGIPYARPPVGDLRWKSPQPIRWHEPRPATAPGAPCPQSDYGGWNHQDAMSGKEDCLTLELRTQSLTPPSPMPVMVWIHGGGNRGGSGIGTIDSSIVDQGIVLVDFNYRLGVLGFLAHPALSAESSTHASGNYALMDQQAALRWVKDNIARFGGDPHRITVFGESAGAQDIGLHLLMPGSQGLFERAIEESGTPDFGVRARSLRTAEALGEDLVRLAGAWPHADGPTLRRLPVASLLRAADSVHVTGLGDDSFIWLQMTIDGVVLPDAPSQLMKRVNARQPLIIGTNIHEFATRNIATDAGATVRSRFGRNTETMLDHYGIPPGAASSPASALAVATDLVFRCPAEAMAHARAVIGAPVWLYRFDHVAENGQAVVHGSEIGSVMAKGKGGAAPMQAYWLAFARTGDPNMVGQPHWPRFDGTSVQRMVFGQDAARAEPVDQICSAVAAP